MITGLMWVSFVCIVRFLKDQYYFKILSAKFVTLFVVLIIISQLIADHKPSHSMRSSNLYALATITYHADFTRLRFDYKVRAVMQIFSRGFLPR